MLIKITDRIWYLPHNEETDRPILGYIKGDNFSLMVDAGNSKKHVDIFLDEISKEVLPYPNFVALTHFHWDHTYGLRGLNSVSIACSKTNEYLNIMKKWKWSDEDMKKRLDNKEDIEFCDEMIKKEYPDRSEINVKTADIVFEDKLWIDLGNISCELIKLVNSHSDDCIVIYVKEEKVVFIGDIIGEDYLNGKIYYKDKVLSLKEDFKNLDFETAIFGHSEKFSKEELMSIIDEIIKSFEN